LPHTKIRIFGEEILLGGIVEEYALSRPDDIVVREELGGALILRRLRGFGSIRFCRGLTVERGANLQIVSGAEV
jgi:hypothetical protein